jgi:hypothetical protein
VERISDYDAIAAVLTKYVEGIVTGSTKLVREAFHPQATMSGHFLVPDRPGVKAFIIVPAADAICAYLDNAPPVAESSPDYQHRIVSIDLCDTVAAATLAERNLEGADFVTYFHLHKVDGQWLIASKATYGQPARPD